MKELNLKNKIISLTQGSLKALVEKEKILKKNQPRKKELILRLFLRKTLNLFHFTQMKSRLLKMKANSLKHWNLIPRNRNLLF